MSVQRGKRFGVADKSVGGKKNFIERQVPVFPEDYIPAEVLRAQRHVATSITKLRQRLSYQLIARLGQCPSCGRAGEKLLL